MPTTLTAAEQVLWTALAPLACARGTLCDSTAPGFALMCEAVAALLTHARALTQRVESLLGRYQLAAMGRPVAAAPAGGVNPWEAIERDTRPASKFDFYGEGARAVGRSMRRTPHDPEQHVTTV